MKKKAMIFALFTMLLGVSSSTGTVLAGPPEGGRAPVLDFPVISEPIDDDTIVIFGPPEGGR